MGESVFAKSESEFSEYLRSGRFEMNLLEHSISSADTKPDKDTSSLEFVRQDKHPETGESIERSWKITFSSEYGRPTAKDDDVLVALMKISQAAGLMNSDSEIGSGKVGFSSYRILKILGWSDCGPNYKAIDDALNRIGGVWIVAKNYWYDNRLKEYVDRKFGIIDDVYLFERDKLQKARKVASANAEAAPSSWLRWSEVMAESFKAGYLTKVDIETYRSIKNPVGRKLYRYLGKHFWNKSTHRVEIKKLCHEKLGYRISETRNSKLLQKIRPVISELEENGHWNLEHDLVRERGKCEVVFKRKRKSGMPKKENQSLLKRLIEIGISKKAAKLAVDTHSPERIEEDIKDADFRRAKGLLKGTHAGCLFSMLQSDSPWARPKGFGFGTKLKNPSRKKTNASHIPSSEKLAVRAFESFLKDLEPAAKAELQKTAMENSPMIARLRDNALAEGNDKTAAEYLVGAMKLEWEKSLVG